jgi:hypothetical protein
VSFADGRLAAHANSWQLTRNGSLAEAGSA